VLAGLLNPTSGGVILDGIPIKEPRQGVGIVFQKANLMPWRSVLRNITLPLEINHIPLAEANQRAAELIELVGLAGFEDWLPHDLSGGMLQRVAIARCLVLEPTVLLLDEPSMGLSPLLMMNVFQALKEINRQEGTAILLVEQNARLALKFSQKGYVLENGNLVLEGDSEILINDPEVKKAYLGG